MQSITHKFEESELLGGDKNGILGQASLFNILTRIIVMKIINRLKNFVLKSFMDFRQRLKKVKLLGNFEKILKIFDENSTEKLNFYFIFIFNLIFNFIFRKFVTKIEPSEIKPVFYNKFFGFGGGGFPPFPPGYALAFLSIIMCSFDSYCSSAPLLLKA